MTNDNHKCLICKKADADICYTTQFGEAFICLACDKQISAIEEDQAAHRWCGLTSWSWLAVQQDYSGTLKHALS